MYNEKWMYRCEFCGVVVLSNEDHGSSWYNDCCGICKTWTYYERIVIKPIFDFFMNLQGYAFVVVDKEKKDDSKEKE